MTGFRLRSGGVVDRTRPVSFRWDGTAFTGLAGDTLASALLANGERIVGRSFKYHRPRGVVSAGVEEAGAVVGVGRGARHEPNAKATLVELHEGLTASGQNGWPSVRADIAQFNDLFGRFFAAGFYYKTFIGLGRGTAQWMFFERFIRRAAGLGTASREADPDAYEYVHDFCDVLVVGAGPAGLAAAEACASAGLDTMLVEQDFALGGALTGAAEGVGMTPAADWIAERGGPRDNLRVLTRTTAFGLYDSNVVGCYERVTDHLADPDPALPGGRIRIVRPRRVILATGAFERPVAFGNNDRPGVMLAGAMKTYADRFAVAPGDRVVLATNNDSGYATARTLARAGVETTLLDSRELIGTTEIAEEARAAGIEVMAGYVPVEARGARGVTGLQVGRIAGHGHARPETTLPCDAVGVSGGWSPAFNLVSHRGVRPVWDPDLACFLSGPLDGVGVTGSAAGVWGTADAVAHGEAVAAAAVEALTGRRRRRKEPATGGWRNPIAPLWEVTVKGKKLKSFVDLQNDVATSDVRLAAREGFRSVEHMKRYTTLGMATDQGKFGGVVGLALLAGALDQTIPETGITTFRPPYTPVPIGAFAGRARGQHWQAVRRTPMHDAQAEGGAVFTDAGLWKRAWHHPETPAESLADGYLREARAVREAVGMVDVTTLGKIMVQGPDAAEFLNRVYVNGFAKLPVMKARYGVMLRDDGIVMDDGVTWRLGEHEFLTSTTTANAGAVMAWFEELLQTRWPELRVHVASVTDQWAGIALAGPKARETLEGLLAEGDVSDDALPFMGIVETQVKAGGGTVPAMIARISFSGELAYEVWTRSDWGDALWRALAHEVRMQGGAPYGMEALGALRIEKGHVTAAELDGRVTLEDAGLGRMASTRKAFIGNVLRQRPHLQRGDRPQLAHFRPAEEGERFSIGAIVCAPDGVRGHGEGWITGVTAAPALGGWLGIGFVRGGPKAWEGREVVIADPIRGRETRARVESPHQYDPDGSRMRA
ncbi:MAG TPA: 2Fe-2S iron-sulfur cluster-binding protein [Thermohalobaculum sp.]|nr:2Fe-2S iron-sulfur cluster-binding protein [Thermohalobaculum sp.]